MKRANNELLLVYLTFELSDVTAFFSNDSRSSRLIGIAMSVRIVSALLTARLKAFATTCGWIPVATSVLL